MERPGHPQPQLRQARKHRSLLPLLRERVLGHCLPMAICQWRQALGAAGRGLGAGGRGPVLGRALAAVQGREEAAGRAMGQGAAVVSQPAP